MFRVFLLFNLVVQNEGLQPPKSKRLKLKETVSNLKLYLPVIQGLWSNSDVFRVYLVKELCYVTMFIFNLR